MNRNGPIRALRLALGAVLAFGLTPAAPSAAAPAPGFDCARIASQVDRMICGDPELLALERRLTLDIRNAGRQPGADPAKLAGDQDRWRRDVRDACYDRPCIARVYRARDAEILSLGRPAASPASAVQIQAFPVPAPLWAKAQALIGRNCAGAFTDRGRFFAGFAAPRGFLPLTLKGSVVEPLQKEGVRFAFLLQTPGATIATCRVADVVALPPAAPDDVFLACQGRSAEVDGFVVRRRGRPPLESFWAVDEANGRLEREAPSALGGVACHQPAVGG